MANIVVHQELEELLNVTALVLENTEASFAMDLLVNYEAAEKMNLTVATDYSLQHDAIVYYDSKEKLHVVLGDWSGEESTFRIGLLMEYDEDELVDCQLATGTNNGVDQDVSVKMSFGGWALAEGTAHINNGMCIPRTTAAGRLSCSGQGS